MHQLLLALLVWQSADSPVIVRTKDGQSLQGKLSQDSFRLRTSFGEAIFERASIHSIEFGDPDVVTTTEKLKLLGKIQIEQLTLKLLDGEKTLKRDDLASLVADRGPTLFEPAKIVDGIARNHMTYHVRVPVSFSPDRQFPALVILHGSNMNAKAYVDTIAAAWPKLADDFIIIGINGEHRVAQSTPENPAFNYSGVNYMGKSKYKGYAGTERESPGLIPEVIREIQERLKLGKVFLGGHSQGGFVTYNVFMNFPDLIAGAFPISAGPWIQSEPTAFDNAELRAAQRRGALAVIHGENDPVVAFSQGKAGFDSFIDDEFPAVRIFADKSAGHMFARLPVESAVRWLEQITSDDAEVLAKFAEERVQAGEYRDATAALRRLSWLNGNVDAARIKSLEEQINQAAEPAATKLRPLIASARDDSWVNDYFSFRQRFQFASSAQPIVESYRNLRANHEELATKLWNEARAEFQKGNQNAGYAKYEEIVKQYYASSWYRYAKPALAKRNAGTKK